MKNYSKIKFSNFSERSKDFIRTKKLVATRDKSYQSIKDNFGSKRKKMTFEELSFRRKMLDISTNACIENPLPQPAYDSK